MNTGTTSLAKFGNDTIFARIAYNDSFINTTLFVIVLNALWIGIDTEWNHDNLKTDADGNELRLSLHDFFLAGENFFCIYFVFEVAMRFFAFKSKWSAIDLSDKWFIFDGILVAFMVMETWVMPILEMLTQGEGREFPGLSVLRLLRLLRLTRMARIMRAVPELVTLIKGMVAAVRSASVILFFLLGVMYVFAIVFTSMLSGERPEGWCHPQRRLLMSMRSRPGSKWGQFARLLQEQDPDLPDENGCIWSMHDDGLYEGEIDDAGVWTGYSRFSSIGSSMMSLFTNGVLGDNLAWCLVHIKNADMFLYWLFIMFMVLSSMTLLNMLIGVLCDVISGAAADEKAESKLAKFQESLEQSFNVIDGSNGAQKNGIVTEDEWHKITTHAEEYAKVKQSFVELGIEERDLDTHLEQLRETLFHHNIGAEVSEQEATLQMAKKGLTFDKFCKKIIDLRPDTPASALDVEMMRMMVVNNERAIKKQMDRVQTNMVAVIRNQYGMPAAAAPTRRSDKLLLDGKADSPAVEGPPWWLKDISNDLLFAALKIREQKMRQQA